jgi:HK97 family phage portal protein
VGILDFMTKKKWQYVQKANLNLPIWSTQKDKQYITEAYNRIVWVYACISAISNATSSVPWLLYRKVRGGRLIEIQDHPILTMLNVKANDYMSSKDFIDYWVTYLAIEGKFFAEYINPDMPTQLFPLYPHYMYPLPSQKEFIAGFEYRMDDTIKYTAKEVLWSKFNDPMDIYQGLSPIKSLSRTIDTENEAVDWNKSTLQNAGVPAGVFQVSNPTPELSERLGEEWLKRFGGGKNARKPLILNSDKASYIPLGLSPIDMDFLNQRKVNRIEICAAFGVPSQIVGDPEGQTYSNYAEAQKAFWENTVITKYLEHIKDKLTQDLLPRYADNLELRYDLSNVQALKENEEMKSNRVMQLFKSGLISRNEARYQLDYDDVDTEEVYYNEIIKPAQAEFKDMKQTDFPTRDDDKEISLRNSNYLLFPLAYAERIKRDYPDIWNEGGNIQGNDTYIVLKRILDEDKTADDLTTNDKDIIKMREAWSARHDKNFLLAGVVAQMKWLMVGSRGLNHMKETIQEAIDKEKKNLKFDIQLDKMIYKNMEQDRNKFYKSVENKIKERFTDEANKVLKALSKSDTVDLLQVVDQTIKQDKSNWESLMTGVYISVIEDFGQKSLNQVNTIKEVTKFNVFDEAIKAYIAKSVAEEVVRIEDTTKDKIKNIIAIGLAQGKRIGKFSLNLPIEDQVESISLDIGRLYLEQFIPNRSETIARTEVISASNSGSLQGAKQSGLKLMKRWIATADDDIRESHLNLLGSSAIGMDELFSVGSSYGQFPGDPNLSAGERINCRCTIAYERIESFVSTGEEQFILQEPETDNPLYPEKIAGVKRGNKMTRDEANHARPNPNFDKSKGYRKNCQSCVVVYEARLRGYDVQTLPNTEGSKLQELSRKTNLAWIDSETGKNPRYLVDNEVNTARKFQKFAEETIEKDKRYTMQFNWKGRKRAGHIIIIDRDLNNKLRLYDPQTSKTFTDNDVPKYFNEIKYITTITGKKYNIPPAILRIDDKEFSLEMVNSIMEKVK